MIPRELLKKIRRIEIRTRHMVQELFGGEYHSVFKGQGMDFAEVREYSAGDEVRSIDWNVSARMGHPFVKVFEEERELTVILAVDLSASGRFGSQALKRDWMAELGAVLAFSAIRNQDKVGLLLFSDRVETYVPPAKGTRHALRVIRDLLYFQPVGTGTRIDNALQHLGRVQSRKAIVFLLSDFLDEGFERSLKVLGRRHDLIAVSIRDPFEDMLPPLGLLHVEDPETGERHWIDCASPRARAAFTAAESERRTALERLFTQARVDHIPISTAEDFVMPVSRFFRMRSRRR